MTENRKGRAGCNQATPKTSRFARNFTALIARIKPVIVFLTLWGLLPVAVADWLINRGEAHDDE